MTGKHGLLILVTGLGSWVNPRLIEMSEQLLHQHSPPVPSQWEQCSIGWGICFLNLSHSRNIDAVYLHRDLVYLVLGLPYGSSYHQIDNRHMRTSFHILVCYFSRYKSSMVATEGNMPEARNLCGMNSVLL